MARVFLDSSLKNAPKEDLRSTIETIFQQLEDQVNEGTQVAGIVGDEALPKGMQRGDVVVKYDPDTAQIQLGLFNGRSVFYMTGTITDEQIAKINAYKGDTSTNAAPTTTEYPNDGDWGFHTDTTGPTYYIAHNIGGTIYKVTLT